MKIKNPWKKTVDISDQVIQAHNYLLSIANLTIRLAGVKRAPRLPDGSRENDVEHSFHLALSATEIAVNYYPKLDIGLVTQFSMVHDLPESYSGDVWTINISEQDRLKKEIAEKEATQKLLCELPPYTAQLLSRYEKQVEPEARFVRYIDKLLPDIIHILAGDACTFRDDHNIQSIEEFNRIHQNHRDRMSRMFPEFKLIQKLHDSISESLANNLFK